MTINPGGFSSQITFLYFDDYAAACQFFDDTLGLEVAYAPGWAKVWRTGAGAFVGAVDAKKGSIAVTQRGGTLISFTVDNVAEWHRHMQAKPITNLSPIKDLPDIGLRSFFFKGPEGYDFEIQEFVQPELKSIF